MTKATMPKLPAAMRLPAPALGVMIAHARCFRQDDHSARDRLSFEQQDR